MGLAWISPLYLAGVLLLALPVLIHLVQRHRLDGIRFPSLMFLEQIPQREKRRLQIRNWLLLLLRSLLLLLLVLAFARPFLTGGSDAAALDPGRRDSVIVIDRSYSMRVADHWQQAQATALRLVDAKQARDRIALVAFDEQSEVLSDLTAHAENLRTVIRRQSPGLKATRLRIGLEQAARLLAGSNASSRQLLLISDFQAAALKPGDAVRISRDIELKTFAVESAGAANAAVSALDIGPSTRGEADEFSLRVEVTNHAATALAQRIGLRLNGREIARRDILLEAGEVASARFDDLGAHGSLVRGVISLEDDALTADNHAYFVYSGKRQVPVLIVESADAGANPSIYIEKALGLARNPVFRVTRRTWKDLTATDLRGWSVIIVNDAPIPGGVLGAALRDFVGAGGGLLVATGDRVHGNWPSGEDGFLPGNLLRRVDAKPGEAHEIVATERGHPSILDATTGHRVDLSSARVFSYRQLEPGADDRVLARFDDGGIALLEPTQGPGRVLVLATTLDRQWNDLSVRPAFVPFLHQALRYLAAIESRPQQFRIGSVVDVMRYARALAGGDAVVAAADDAPLVVEAPSSGEIRLRRQAPLLTLEEAGFYQVHRATPAKVEVVLAANIDPREANLEVLDVAAFEEEIRATAEAPVGATRLSQRQAAEAEQQQQLWYGVLLAALALMLIEAVAANRLARNRAAGQRGSA